MTLSRFVKVFNNLPPAERDLVCTVVNGDGITWRLAYKEIKEKTELGEVIQKQLEDLELI